MLKITMQHGAITLVVERASGGRVLGMTLPIDEDVLAGVLDALAAYGRTVTQGNCVARSSALCDALSGKLLVAAESPPPRPSAARGRLELARSAPCVEARRLL